MTRTYLLREGSPVPDGVGALRRLAVGPFGSCEEVVEFEPPVHLGYVALHALVRAAVRTGTRQLLQSAAARRRSPAIGTWLNG
jgi:hypothetical protein